MKPCTAQEFKTKVLNKDAICSAHFFHNSSRMFTLWTTRHGKSLGRINDSADIELRVLNEGQEYLLAE